MSASQDARQVLLEISMLAGGATQNLNASRGGGDAIGPGGDGKHMLLEWGQRFASASWERLPELVVEARAELDQFKRRTAPLDASQDPEGERRKQMLEHSAGLPLGEVAAIYGYSTTLVKKYRVADERDPATGVKLDKGNHQRARALQLLDEGSSYRDVWRVTGVSVGTLHRWSKEAA